jgi:hypothetical protein
LTYKNVPTPGAAAPTSDTITVAAHDASGDMASERVAITLTPTPGPSFISIGPAAESIVATGNDVFALTKGTIAAPGEGATGGEQILDFHSAAAGGSTSDFLAFHGFAPGAQLVFVRDAAAHGVIDPSMQYYRVADSHGGSPAFLVQMASGSAAHLTAADYGFYPS